MSKFKTAIIEIAGTDFSKAVKYNSDLNLLAQSEDFVDSIFFERDEDVQVNVYDPSYSLEVCVNKFYV